MRASFTLTIRLGVMLAFLLLMPVLAVPQINRWVDEKYLGVLPPAKTTVNSRGVSLIAKKTASSSSYGDERRPAMDQRSAESNLATQNRSSESGGANTSASEIDLARYRELQTRLQRLGVQYLVLEKWPGQEQLYRFHCRMPVPGSSAYARPFEARDADPLKAVQLVLSDVETWCASHSTTTSTKLR